MTSVPDFFQEEGEGALRSQVDWLEQHLGLGNTFFAKLLREDPGIFSRWRTASGTLAGDKQAILRDWWHTVLHLLSFQNFDEQKLRTMLEQAAPGRPRAAPSGFSPPWSASSLKKYLEDRGPDAIREVDRWVESFRFGDPYAPARQGDSCLSTPA
jgi:phytoene dehydrogenase-like protein